jgi:hypothetical protein
MKSVGLKRCSSSVPGRCATDPRPRRTDHALTLNPVDLLGAGRCTQ